eukprot:CFRG8465T1
MNNLLHNAHEQGLRDFTRARNGQQNVFAEHDHMGMNSFTTVADSGTTNVIRQNLQRQEVPRGEMWQQPIDDTVVPLATSGYEGHHMRRQNDPSFRGHMLGSQDLHQQHHQQQQQAKQRQTQYFPESQSITELGQYTSSTTNTTPPIQGMCSTARDHSSGHNKTQTAYDYSQQYDNYRARSGSLHQTLSQSSNPRYTYSQDQQFARGTTGYPNDSSHDNIDEYRSRRFSQYSENGRVYNAIRTSISSTHGDRQGRSLAVGLKPTNVLDRIEHQNPHGYNRYNNDNTNSNIGNQHEEYNRSEHRVNATRSFDTPRIYAGGGMWSTRSTNSDGSHGYNYGQSERYHMQSHGKFGDKCMWELGSDRGWANNHQGPRSSDRDGIDFSTGDIDLKQPEKKMPPNRRPPIVRLDRPCTHCGITESCTWRPGPDGRSTLCNTCGYFYRRRKCLSKKREGLHRPTTKVAKDTTDADYNSANHSNCTSLKD